MAEPNPASEPLNGRDALIRDPAFLPAMRAFWF